MWPEVSSMNLLYFTTAYERAIFGNRVHEEFLMQLHGADQEVSVLVPDSRAREGTAVVEPGPPAVTRVPVSQTHWQRLQNLASRRLAHYDHFASLRSAYRAHLQHHPGIDLIHVESIYPLGALAATVRDRRPFIATVRGGDLIADDSIAYGFARFRVARALISRCFARASRIRAVSPGARAMAIAYGCPAERIVVVPRNIRDDCFPADIAAVRSAARHQIDAQHGTTDQRVIVAAGRLLPVKGFDDLIRATPAILQDVPAARILICGPNRNDPVHGDYGAHLMQLAHAAGVAERVTLVGHVAPEAMVTYLAGADLVAVPSIIEGGNKILVEGAAVGTPFVATGTSGTVGFFDERHCMVVPPRDPAALAAACSMLLGDAAGWQRRSEACIAQRDRFRSHAVAGQMLDVYHESLAQHQAGGR
jgi:glycosyltransferase involved in cell wall biosynthesis